MEDIYQEFIIELYKNPLNFGRLENANFHAEAHNATCGDVVEIFIRAKDGVVSEARFAGKGCAISQASASLLMGHIIGKKISALADIGKEDVLALLKINLRKNPTRMRCALLPLDALKSALKKP